MPNLISHHGWYDTSFGNGPVAKTNIAHYLSLCYKCVTVNKRVNEIETAQFIDWLPHNHNLKIVWLLCACTVLLFAALFLTLLFLMGDTCFERYYKVLIYRCVSIFIDLWYLNISELFRVKPEWLQHFFSSKKVRKLYLLGEGEGWGSVKVGFYPNHRWRDTISLIKLSVLAEIWSFGGKFNFIFAHFKVETF